jgi:hypothetical protein
MIPEILLGALCSVATVADALGLEESHEKSIEKVEVRIFSA